MSRAGQESLHNAKCIVEDQDMLDFVAQRGLYTISEQIVAFKNLSAFEIPLTCRMRCHPIRFVGVFLHIYSVDPILVAREI